MKTGTVVFDGVEYPDGAASDPVALGWMQRRAAAAREADQIRGRPRRSNFPQIRWSLSHMRELVPTAAIWRGSGAASELGAARCRQRGGNRLAGFRGIARAEH